MPDFDEIREYGSIADEGWHSASVVEMEYKLSKSGNHMLVPTIAIDAGDFTGTKLNDYYVLSGDGKDLGWGKLKKMSNAAGFVFKTVNKPGKLAAQFMELDAPLRVDIRIKHSFNIKTSGSWKEVSQEEFDRWKAQGGDGNRRANLTDYRPVQNDPDLDLGFAARKDEGEEGHVQPPEPASVRADDDDLPF